MQEGERLDVIKAAVNMESVSCKVCNVALKFIDKMLYSFGALLHTLQENLAPHAPLQSWTKTPTG